MGRSLGVARVIKIACLVAWVWRGGGTVCGHSGQDVGMANIYLHEGLAGYDGRTDVCRLAICFDMDGMEDGMEDGERYPGSEKRRLRTYALVLLCHCARLPLCVCLPV